MASEYIQGSEEEHVKCEVDDGEDGDDEAADEEEIEEEDVKDLRMENYMLRKENEKLRAELQKQLETLEIRSSGTVGVEKRKEELDQGKKNSGESCSALGGGEKVRCCEATVDFGHALSADAIRRYSRQLLVPSFGVAGQERLLKSSALVVGCGGLGSPIALYLAAAGVGSLFASTPEQFRYPILFYIRAALR